VRDLAYFLCPVEGPAWRRNVERLVKYWHLFTGKKVVCVASGPVVCKVAGKQTTRNTEPPAAARAAFPADPDLEFIDVANDAGLREVKGLVPTLERLRSTDPGRAVFLAHTKGVTYPEPHALAHRWAEVMYESLLGHWPVVEAALSRFPAAGSFKRVGQTLGVTWHYSGSFCWLRSADLFARDWRRVDQRWWGVESYPGRHFHESEAGVVFMSAKFPNLDLYRPECWREVVEPAWAAWVEANKDRRTAP
jgi:hypothetical protein